MKIEEESRMEEIDAEEAMVCSLENEFADLFTAFAPPEWSYTTEEAGLNDHFEPYITITITREPEDD